MDTRKDIHEFYADCADKLIRETRAEVIKLGYAFGDADYDAVNYHASEIVDLMDKLDTLIDIIRED